ncbi:hypothetical protein MMC22_002284 [Lobaria immixta]|nr:hypothetical protein [Lobaria immixta]
MALATAIIAGSMATAGYLDAKFHLRNDIEMLYANYKAQQDYIKAAVQKYGDVVAIWSREGVYTWHQTHDRACQYAAYFLELAVRPGDLVAVYLENSPDFLFLWLGLWAIGCAPAMINVNLASDALIHCLKVSGARMLLVDEDEKCRARINAETQRVEIELEMKVVEVSALLKKEIAARKVVKIDDVYRKDINGNSPVALFYTSGTTGLPKSIPFLTSRLYLAVSARFKIQMNERPGQKGDRWYICMPIYHASAGNQSMANILSGISIAVGKRFSVHSFWTEVRDSESTFILYIGETARYLLAASPHPLDKQHKVRCMFGNGLRADVWQSFQERFGVDEVWEFFNSSEGMFGSIVRCRGDYLANAVGHHGAIRRYILRNTYIPVETDIETNSIVRDPKTGFAKRNLYEDGGEIIVQIPNKTAFPGYRGAPEATEKKFARDVFRKGDLYYRTGDALRRTSDGRWFFQDRLGDTYRWKGENVSTAEVAQVLGQFPGILEANVYGVQVPGSDGQAGCVAVIIAPERRETFDWASLARFALMRLPRYAVPVFVRAIAGEIGVMGSHNNKQNKVPLRAEGVNPGLRGTKVAGGNADLFYWMPAKEERYIPFEEKEWALLVQGTARL